MKNPTDPDRLPPGVSASIGARRLLVLAPHYDDEVLGCGGLIASTAAAGGAVRVLFLSDGAGGAERAADAAYAARRREESSVALSELGVSGAEHLALPDGGLEDRIEEIVAALRRAVLTFRPEAILCPSPLEITADHRAAFTALYAFCAPLRRGDDEADETFAVLERCEVLLYEVNQPAHPNLLVDVSLHVDRLARAMAAYGSQEERHPYWRAGLGLRHFRTLTLGPDVEAAEAYHRLPALDLRLRSREGWVQQLGGRPSERRSESGPLVSVIVRTKDRPALLAEALASLAASSYRRLEVVLVNDGGAAPAVADDFPLPLRRVDLAAGRGRAGAANAGLREAQGDYVAFLDDDDLVEPEHYAVLVGLVSSAGVRAAYTDAAVGVYELDAARGGWRLVARRLPYSRDFDAERLRFDNYIPFHTLLVERRLAEEAGPLDESLDIFEDWDWILRLAERAPLHHAARVTCEYRHFRGVAHHALGDIGRARPDFVAMKAKVLDKHGAGKDPLRLAAAVDSFRAEEVAAREEAAAARREGDEDRRRRVESEEAFHRARGEATAARGHVEILEGDARRLRAELGSRDADLRRQDEELRRVFAEEGRLGSLATEQAGHIDRLHGEVERLQAVVTRVERFWPWRLWRRLRG